MRGRNVLPSDDEDAPLVAVVNETFARRMWGEDDPIGRTITRNGFGSGDIRVVGVVRDIAVDGLVGDVPMAAYYPWAQTMRESTYGILVLRTTGDPAALAPAVRAIVPELEPAAVVGRIETMTTVVDEAMSETLRLRFFLTLFSAMGLLMGAVGIYGVVSYGVQQRSAEFGIRMALGARPRLLLRDVVGRGMLPVLLGVAGGIAAALLASDVLTRFLYEVAPTDPVPLLGAAAVLGVVGAVAALRSRLARQRDGPGEGAPLRLRPRTGPGWTSAAGPRFHNARATTRDGSAGIPPGRARAVTGIVDFLLATPLLLVPILIIVAMIAFAILKRLLKIAAVLAIAGVLYVLLVNYVGTG